MPEVYVCCRKQAGRARVEPKDLVVAYNFDFDGILDDLQHADDEYSVWEGLTRFLRSQAIEPYVYHHLPALGATDYEKKYSFGKSFDRAQEGTCRVIDFGFNRKLREKARSMIVPKFWDLDCVAQNVTKANEALGVNLSLARSVSGVSIPVHGPNGRNGCFSLAFSALNRSEEIQAIRWVCQNAHQNYCRLLKLQNNILPKLTNREKEILTWIALGKTNTDISDILGISHHTVGTYVRRIFIKTNTSDELGRSRFAAFGLIALRRRAQSFYQRP